MTLVHDSLTNQPQLILETLHILITTYKSKVENVATTYKCAQVGILISMPFSLSMSKLIMIVHVLHGTQMQQW